MKNFQTHLYYYLDNEHLRADLAVVKAKGYKAVLRLRSTTTPDHTTHQEVPVNEIRIKGEVTEDLGLHNDDDDATWD